MLLLHVIAGVDYEPLRRNVTLSDLQATENLEVAIFNDSILERTETFEARIIIPEEIERLGVTLGSPSVLSIRILDDDDGKSPCLCSYCTKRLREFFSW